MKTLFCVTHFICECILDNAMMQTNYLLSSDRLHNMSLHLEDSTQQMEQLKFNLDQANIVRI